MRFVAGKGPIQKIAHEIGVESWDNGVHVEGAADSARGVWSATCGVQPAGEAVGKPVRWGASGRRGGSGP